MNLHVRTFDEVRTDIPIGVFALEESQTPLGINNKLGKDIIELARQDGFKGKTKECVILHTSFEGFPRKIAVSGLGKKKELTLEEIRKASAVIIKQAENIAAPCCTIVMPLYRELIFDYADIASAIVEGALLKSYRFSKYQTLKEDKPKPVETVDICVHEKRCIPSIQKALQQTSEIATCVCMVRDLVNEPSSAKTPVLLAEHAKKMAKPGMISVKVYEKQEIEKMGMGGLLGVSRGSHEPPVFIHLTYKPKQTTNKTIVFIGKGITFDSGGLNLKLTKHIENMKVDMAGAATVLGIFNLLPLIRPACTVHGLIPATENMPGGGAMKPADVLKAYNGKTIEVLNTDAEGRLILADALVYGANLKPHLMIDIATLTGAAQIALGPRITAIMGTDQKHIDRIKIIGETLGEYFLQFPLFKEYDNQMESTVADLKNIGSGKGGGTIIGGLFLKNFVHDIPWIHCDIASTAWTEVDLDYCPIGGTGVPLRTIIRWLNDFR